MPRSILDMTAEEDNRPLDVAKPASKKPFIEAGPGGTPENVGELPTPTNSQTPTVSGINTKPMADPFSSVAGGNGAALPLPSTPAFNSGSAVAGVNTPNTQGPQVSSGSSARDSTGNVTRDSSGNTLGSSYESPESILRMAQGRLGQTNAANLSTNPNPGLNYGVQGASLETAADSGSISNEGATPQSPIDSLGQTNLDENRAIEVMRMANEQPISMPKPNPTPFVPAGSGGTPENVGELPTPTNAPTTQTDISGGNFVDLDPTRNSQTVAGNQTRNNQMPAQNPWGLTAPPGSYVSRDGQIKPRLTTGPIADEYQAPNGGLPEGGMGNSQTGGTAVYTGKDGNSYIDLAERARTIAPTSYMDVNGNIQPRNGSGPQPNEWKPGMNAYARVGGNSSIQQQINQQSNQPGNTNRRGGTIIGASGQTRQVRADGAILDAQGNPQGDGAGNQLNVGEDGTITAGGKPWGYVQANGQVRQGLRPAAGVADPAQGTGMDFTGRTIIGLSGVPRQVDQQGRILTSASGGYQLAEDGSQLIVGKDGKITAGGKQWGYLDAQGKVTKSETGGPPANGAPGNGAPGTGSPNTPIATQAGLISPDMLVENRIANLMKSGNPLLEQAVTRAKQLANERGTLNSTMTAQAGTEAALSTAREIASQDANTLKDAALTEYQTKVQMIMQDKSLSAAEKENAIQRAFTQRENALNRTSDAESRASDRQFQREENNTQRQFQGDMTREGWRFDTERDTINYQRNIANFDRQINASKDEGERNFFRTMQVNYNQSILTIQTDPNMTPEQRAAQIDGMNSIYSGITYNGAFLNLVRPASSTTTTTGTNTATSGGTSSGTGSDSK